MKCEEERKKEKGKARDGEKEEIPKGNFDDLGSRGINCQSSIVVTGGQWLCFTKVVYSQYQPTKYEVGILNEAQGI